MKLRAFRTACGVAAIMLALVTNAPAALAAGVNPEEVAKLLENLNFPATPGTSDVGTPTIETRFGDVDTTIQLGDCSGEPATCRDAAFIAEFDATDAPPLADIVAANWNWSFIRLFADPDSNTIGAEMDVTLVSGDVDVRLSVVIDLWRNATSALSRQITIEPPDDVMDGDAFTSAMAAILPVEGLLGDNDDQPPELKLVKVTPSGVAGMLEELGYAPELQKGGKFEMYRLDVGEIDTLVGARLCSSKLKHCGALTFVHIREAPQGATPELLNRFNGEEWFVRVFPVEEGRLFFSMELSVFDGLSPTDLERYLDAWEGTVAGFDDFAREHGG